MARREDFDGLRSESFSASEPTREKFIAGLDSGRPVNVGDYAVRFTPQDRVGGDFVELTVVDRYGKIVR